MGLMVVAVMELDVAGLRRLGTAAHRRHPAHRQVLRPVLVIRRALAISVHLKIGHAAGPTPMATCGGALVVSAAIRCRGGMVPAVQALAVRRQRARMVRICRVRQPILWVIQALLMFGRH